ncbi:hypothetical protein Tco_0537320 [Tanacetum coccineum]
MVVRTHPTLSPGYSAKLTEEMHYHLLHSVRVDETPTYAHARLPVRTTWEDPEDGTVYMDIECDMPSVCSPVQTPPSPVGTPASPKWFLESPLVSPIIPSPITTLVPVVALDKGELLDIRAQLELHGSILHTHTERLDALPPTLFEGYGRDFTKLFSRSEAVREEIHS